MGDWNLGVALDIAADVRGDEDAIVQGDTRVSWSEFSRRADNLAAWMLGQGGTPQGKVAVYTYNCPAYLETCLATFKASLVSVNVNYRYRADELEYLLDNADAEFVVVGPEFVETLASVAPKLSKLRGILVLGDDTPLAGLPHAVRYEEVAGIDRDLLALSGRNRSGDDVMMLYTGGTTGMPKGVMWRQDDLYFRLGGGGLGPSPETADELRAFIENPPLRLKLLVGCPLMHGTGWFTALVALLTGGCVVLMDTPEHFDPEEFFAIVEREHCTSATIVGDSFAKPLVRTLAAAKEDKKGWDLSSMVMMVSSGVMWSQDTKMALLEYHPGMMLVDQFSSSEALGMGMSITSAAGPVQTAKFQLGDKVRLFSEDLQLLDNTPGTKGLVGVGGPQPVGYYKDPEKSARTFVEAEGGRYSIPGDWAIVGDDGVSLNLLGRGSVCINTGGEKVFPEEVEEVVKTVAGVRDCVVVGVPDEKWGQAITAVCSALPGETVDADAVISKVKANLAGYKAPKHVVVVDDVYRSPSGKADFKRTTEMALEQLGIEA